MAPLNCKHEGEGGRGQRDREEGSSLFPLEGAEGKGEERGTRRSRGAGKQSAGEGHVHRGEGMRHRVHEGTASEEKSCKECSAGPRRSSKKQAAERTLT